MVPIEWQISTVTWNPCSKLSQSFQGLFYVPFCLPSYDGSFNVTTVVMYNQNKLLSGSLFLKKIFRVL